MESTTACSGLGAVDPSISDPSACAGVTDAVAINIAKPNVMIHIENRWGLELQQNCFDTLVATGKVSTADWDMFGFSFYPFYGTNATLVNFKGMLDTLALSCGKPLHVVETDWPDSYPWVGRWSRPD